MTRALYLDDSYLQETTATVTAVIDERFVVLDQTVFYPQGGGQPGDTGVLVRNGESFTVINTTKRDGAILHELDRAGVYEGDEVLARIDWQRRYAHMRYHTAAHLLSAVIHKHAGALISGNQISAEKLRVDFSLEEYDPLQLQHYLAEANRIIAQHLTIHVRTLPREEALALPGIVKLAGALPPNIPELRIVSIGEGEQLVDEQADGGTHVHNTKEIGTIVLLNSENKGKNNRRMSVVLQ
jgi:misacylated tRNA(Ala) deacylase